MDKIDRRVKDNSNILEGRIMDKLDELVGGYNELREEYNVLLSKLSSIIGIR